MTPEEKRARLENILSEWRQQGGFDYPLTEEGKVARLEDAREVGKVTSAYLLEVMSNPQISQFYRLTNPGEYDFLCQLGVVTHLLTCVDPECRIIHPQGD